MSSWGRKEVQKIGRTWERIGWLKKLQDGGTRQVRQKIRHIVHCFKLISLIALKKKKKHAGTLYVYFRTVKAKKSLWIKNFKLHLNLSDLWMDRLLLVPHHNRAGMVQQEIRCIDLVISWILTDPQWLQELSKASFLLGSKYVAKHSLPMWHAEHFIGTWKYNIPLIKISINFKFNIKALKCKTVTKPHALLQVISILYWNIYNW